MLLRQHRMAAGLTQTELAKCSGLSMRGISDLERGARTAPHPDSVRRLAAALQLTDEESAALMAAARQAEHSRLASATEDCRSPRPLALPGFW